MKRSRIFWWSNNFWAGLPVATLWVLFWMCSSFFIIPALRLLVLGSGDETEKVPAAERLVWGPVTPPRVCRAKTGRGPAGRGTAAAPGPAPPTESDGGGTKGPASGKRWSPWALTALTPPDTKAPSVGGSRRRLFTCPQPSPWDPGRWGRLGWGLCVCECAWERVTGGGTCGRRDLEVVLIRDLGIAILHPPSNFC